MSLVCGARLPSKVGDPGAGCQSLASQHRARTLRDYVVELLRRRWLLSNTCETVAVPGGPPKLIRSVSLLVARIRALCALGAVHSLPGIAFGCFYASNPLGFGEKRRNGAFCEAELGDLGQITLRTHCARGLRRRKGVFCEAEFRDGSEIALRSHFRIFPFLDLEIKNTQTGWRLWALLNFLEELRGWCRSLKEEGNTEGWGVSMGRWGVPAVRQEQSFGPSWIGLGGSVESRVIRTEDDPTLPPNGTSG